MNKRLGEICGLVSRPASFRYFRVRHARQLKAWPAANIGHIAKGHNGFAYEGYLPRAPRLRAGEYRTRGEPPNLSRIPRIDSPGLLRFVWD